MGAGSTGAMSAQPSGLSPNVGVNSVPDASFKAPATPPKTPSYSSPALGGIFRKSRVLGENALRQVKYTRVRKCKEIHKQDLYAPNRTLKPQRPTTRTLARGTTRTLRRRRGSRFRCFHPVPTHSDRARTPPDSHSPARGRLSRELKRRSIHRKIHRGRVSTTPFTVARPLN